SCRSSAGPLKHKSESANAKAASASSKICFAASNFWAKSFPMPGACDPWPGKIYAIADCRLPIVNLFVSEFLSVTTPNRAPYCSIENRQCLHHRITTPPQVDPPPKVAIKTMSSFLTRPVSTHSSRQIGIDADDVL